jgi:histidyl-tRNA synthetase
MSTLSSQPYKGTRDFYPDDKRIQNYIFSVWREVVEQYGYQEYSAPLIEPLEVYLAKSGQELANEQTYSFIDRGDRTVAIRPEMTPSISRMVAAKRQELGYPARLYSIANFMRYERPQRGREREFWQLNADIFGVDNVDADAEVIELAHEIMNKFGASEEMYVIRVNSRSLIEHMMGPYLGLDEIGAQLMIKLFDRKDKITDQDFTNQAREIFGASASEEGLKKITDIIEARQSSELPKQMHELQAVKDLDRIFLNLKDAGVNNARFDITLMRGLDYYTGMVFEVFDLHPDNSRAMFGGGRYDGLVGLFGAEPIPTVGFAPGLTTTEIFLRSHNLLPTLGSHTDLNIVVVDIEAQSAALNLARKLRKKGLNVEVDITGRKIERQIKSAIKKSIPYNLFFGQDEMMSHEYTIKNTASQEVKKVSLDDIIITLNKNQ